MTNRSASAQNMTTEQWASKSDGNRLLHCFVEADDAARRAAEQGRNGVMAEFPPPSAEEAGRAAAIHKTRVALETRPSPARPDAHNLVVSRTDEILVGHCSCGKPLGRISASASLDELTHPRETHLTTEGGAVSTRPLSLAWSAHRDLPAAPFAEHGGRPVTWDEWSLSPIVHH